MDLQAYIERRDFSKTPEPAAETSNNNDSLMFVIQKHAASHLHYDFRLEMDGVYQAQRPICQHGRYYPTGPISTIGQKY